MKASTPIECSLLNPGAQRVPVCSLLSMDTVICMPWSLQRDFLWSDFMSIALSPRQVGNVNSTELQEELSVGYMAIRVLITASK